MLSEFEKTDLAGPASEQSRPQVLDDKVELLSPESRKDNSKLANNQKNANKYEQTFSTQQIDEKQTE